MNFHNCATKSFWCWNLFINPKDTYLFVECICENILENNILTGNQYRLLEYFPGDLSNVLFLMLFNVTKPSFLFSINRFLIFH